jgi:hypothetical protein
MTRRITMPARTKDKLDVDKWVEARDYESVAKTVKPKRLTIDIDAKLHTCLKMSCAQRGIQIADLVRADTFAE